MDIYKCPFSENGLRELKFSYIITYFGIRPANLSGVYCDLYAAIIYQGGSHVATIMVQMGVVVERGCINYRYCDFV
jgi:hypothetical protein